MIGCLILRQNLDELENVKQWANKNKISLNHQIVGFHDTFLENLDTQKNVDFRKNEKNQLLNFLKTLNNSYYWQDMYNMYKTGSHRTTPCPFLKDMFVLDGLGDVYYCLCVKPIGNFRKDFSVSQIYFDPQNLQFRNTLPKTVCYHCNSGCEVNKALCKDFKKYIWFQFKKNVKSKFLEQFYLN